MSNGLIQNLEMFSISTFLPECGQKCHWRRVPEWPLACVSEFRANRLWDVHKTIGLCPVQLWSKMFEFVCTFPFGCSVDPQRFDQCGGDFIQCPFNPSVLAQLVDRTHAFSIRLCSGITNPACLFNKSPVFIGEKLPECPGDFRINSSTERSHEGDVKGKRGF